ncbi:hypothetical protein GCU56_10245 [Geodermatophilus sabuli]|uniref:LVIVD repeat-containing protein n=1 Tax=Geodermatophilus sabuli TaxID=1564158 RepID=A0A7K3W0R2_9ACTN|nr:hypothetical protein [Geodermatophilus sabuli]NEK58250.1 hypothetical protein [Geodermatophilus sabuli]
MTSTAASVPAYTNSPGLEFVSYHDLEERPAFKLALHPVDGRWLLYTGHIWHNGWSVLDVTDPAAPEFRAFVEGPPNTWTLQVQVADGLLVTALEEIGGPDEERAVALWGRQRGVPHDEGVLFWDLAQPEAPRRLGQFRTGGAGTHRNYYVGGDRAYLAANMAGYRGNIFVSLDVSDPADPREVGRWHFPGQWIAGGETPDDEHYLHGPPYVLGDRAYVPYGRAGFVILDLSVESEPRLVGRLDIGDFGSIIGVHSVLPIPERGLAVVSTEVIMEGGQDPMNLVVTVDLSDETRPRPLGHFPVPVPPAELRIADFDELGGRFGPHNIHLPHGLPWLAAVEDHVHVTYENAGLWTFDISNPRLPRVRDHFIPAAPTVRRGLLPRQLATQTEDVLVDARGYVYISDKNHGLFILKDHHVAERTSQPLWRA